MSISDALGGAGASLILHDLEAITVGIAASVRVDPQALREYSEQYVKFDPWLQRAHRTGRIRAGLALIGTQLVPHDEFVKTRYCREFADRYGIVRFLGGAVLVEGSVSSSLSLTRRDPDFSERELEFVRELMPHLARALQWHYRVTDLECTKQAAADALERLPIGVILLDRAGRVLLANRPARAIFELQDGLSLQEDGVIAARHDESVTLRKLITSALTVRKTANHLSGGGAMTLSRPSLNRPFELLVCPLGGSVVSIGDEGRASVAVFVSDPNQCGVTDLRVLQELYGLTPTEARVASGLAGGLTIRDIAKTNTMTTHTARWHAKNVFAKTETSGQSALVRRLVMGPASVSSPST
jgi:DNA-binding CsgD family transcriptional regulator/PAS domain-containing protein